MVQPYTPGLCIKSIYIQSEDDLIIFNNQNPLKYIDIRNAASAKEVIFKENIGVFAKPSTLTVYKKNTQYHVIDF